ncbi:uncharacterized protein PG998_012825 [Apiospora kogelbergensis]|uniref:uncharacterized protein n=1 Tax=Apiospora kogelbergensis TaxID=1337665 RepID=UPI00312F53A7
MWCDLAGTKRKTNSSGRSATKHVLDRSLASYQTELAPKITPVPASVLAARTAGGGVLRMFEHIMNFSCYDVHNAPPNQPAS